MTRATCFGRKLAIIRTIQNYNRSNKVCTQWGLISFTVKNKLFQF